nr:cold shock domain-containing protein [Streptomyces sp. ML-6]
MATGTVKRSTAGKDFGFIAQDRSGPDVFAHYSAINPSDCREAQKAQVMTFDVTQGQKGHRRGTSTRPDLPAPAAYGDPRIDPVQGSLTASAGFGGRRVGCRPGNGGTGTGFSSSPGTAACHNVPVAAVNSGQQGIRRGGQNSTFIERSRSSAALRAIECRVIPKLRARVRFSSPAPR